MLGGYERVVVKGSSELPGLPGGLPGVGHLLAFRRDPLGVLRRLSALPGDLWALRLGTRRVIVASSPAVAEALLVRLAPALEKGPLVRRWSRGLLGEGLIACATDAHATHRAQLTLAFSPPRREATLRTLGLAAAEALAKLRAATTSAGAGGMSRGGLSIELGQAARELVAAVLGPALFPTVGAEAWRAIVAALDAVNGYLTARIRNPLLPPIGGPTPGARRAATALRALNTAIDSEIRARRAALSPPEAAASSGDLLDVLLGSRDPDGSPLSSDRIRDELVTFLAASYETTASALTWTLALLAQHRAIAAGVRQEARAVARAGAPLTAEDLPALVACEQAIREALRLWPPVHTLGREAREPILLGGHTLPPGTILAFSTYLLHRRPDLYPAPDRFSPDRFSQAPASPARFAYLPFGAGPRACIGGDLALCTLKLLVSGLLAHDTLVPAATFHLAPQLLVTLRPRSPLSLHLAPE